MCDFGLSRVIKTIVNPSSLISDKDKILIDAYKEAKLNIDSAKVNDMELELGLCISEI